MRRAMLALCAMPALSACSGMEPGTPMMMGANEMQDRPGAFSGPSGQFVLAGGQGWTDAVADAGQAAEQ